MRDSFGVPHIFAKTDAEVSYGLAWAEAEDDFKSMQLVVLPTKGLMGKVLGKSGAAGDYAFALFRCREITKEKWNTLSLAFIKLINGYVQGINDYAASHPDEVLTKKLFPITTEDYVASSVLALTVFNGGGAALQQIFANQVPSLPFTNEQKGSNGIAVHSSKTTTGESFLVINAHQPNTGPQSFYEAHLCSEEGLNILGGLLAGGPCILHGVNENLGWAHTVNFCDRLDVYQLEMNPDNNEQYKFDGQWINLEKKKIRLKIKNVPVRIGRSLYWSKYGATMKNKQGYFSIRLGANMDIRALEQWYMMDKAKNFTEFYHAIGTQGLSMFNITYADRFDTIFYINNVLMPVRNNDPAYNWKKTLPGNTSKTLWNSFRPFTSLPQYINPPAGFLFNTNHSPFLATAPENNLKANDFAKTDGWETWHNNRSLRILELMPVKDKLSYEALKKIKFDRQLPKELGYPYGIKALFALDGTVYPELTQLINTLKSWDKRGDADSKGAAIFLLSYIHLNALLKGQDTREITTAEAVTTLQSVKDYMLKYFGTTDLSLGDIQKLVRGDKEYPVSGFADLLCPQWTEAYNNGKLKSIGGDAYIELVRFRKNQLPLIESVNTYGASSHPGNKHFDDQVPLFLQQKTKTMTLDKATVYKKAERIYHPGE
ncbi:MAG: penicillin acylase family protein [Ferruginibacter sp.]